MGVTFFDLNRLWPELRLEGSASRPASPSSLRFGSWPRIAEFLVCRIRNRMPHNTALLALLGRVTKISIVIFGVATALGTMGINVSALVAGLGLTAFALGFAFKDVLSNLLAGILILLFRPFVIDDQISVTGQILVTVQTPETEPPA